MAFITLLRHAKAAAALPSQKDFDRPLTERGRTDAARMGQLLADLAPDAALVSAAARTTETWEIAATAFTPPPPATVERTLYLCTPAFLVRRIREVPAETKSLIVVGHNPCMEEVALWLAGKTKGPDVSRMHEKFPTAAIATFELSGGWRDLEPATVTFKRFVTPRSLD